MVPEVQALEGAKRKVLPPGRYMGTFEELEHRYVLAGDENRKAIWDAFLRVVNDLRNVLGSLSAVWIGGSFITSEPTPHDIDVVFLITQDCFNKATSNVARFALGVLSNEQGLPNRLDLYVDGYLLVVPPTGMSLSNDVEMRYATQRGYWDQFWSKTRFEDDADERWQYPAAGYVEVMVDGFDNIH